MHLIYDPIVPASNALLRCVDMWFGVVWPGGSPSAQPNIGCRRRIDGLAGHKLHTTTLGGGLGVCGVSIVHPGYVAIVA